MLGSSVASSVGMDRFRPYIGIGGSSAACGAAGGRLTTHMPIMTPEGALGVEPRRHGMCDVPDRRVTWNYAQRSFCTVCRQEI